MLVLIMKHRTNATISSPGWWDLWAWQPSPSLLAMGCEGGGRWGDSQLIPQCSSCSVGPKEGWLCSRTPRPWASSWDLFGWFGLWGVGLELGQFLGCGGVSYDPMSPTSTHQSLAHHIMLKYALSPMSRRLVITVHHLSGFDVIWRTISAGRW